MCRLAFDAIDADNRTILGARQHIFVALLHMVPRVVFSHRISLRVFEPECDDPTLIATVGGRFSVALDAIDF